MISNMKNAVLSILEEASARKLPDNQYSHMKYPKLLALMNFYVDRYEIPGFGRVMIMHTQTKMGMELLTMSFMPDGICLPYLLVDAMTMKQKRCVFVEYYGCGYENLEEERLMEVYEQYKMLPDYAEKPNWYIQERRPYSLIKSGEEQQLLQMAADSISAYLKSIPDAGNDPAYNECLKAFRQRMISEGNPSSRTLEMLLKKDGAVAFMKDVVMPLSEK